MKVIEHDWNWRGTLTTRTAAVTDIVVHHADGDLTAAEIHRIHREERGWAGIGYHYVVELDGDIHRGRPEKKVGAHCNEHNAHTIGVCFSGDYEVRKAMPRAQLGSGRELIADLRRRYPKARVRGHGQMPANATACPGRHFPMAQLLEGASVSDVVPRADYPRLKARMVQYMIRAQLAGDPVSVRDCEGFGVLSEKWGGAARRLAWRISGRLDGVKQTTKPTRELLEALGG